MSNPTWLANTNFSPFAVIIDPNGNVQQAGPNGGQSGIRVPEFAEINLGSITNDNEIPWTLRAILSTAVLPTVLGALPTPDFIGDADGTDPNLILQDMVTEFQSATNRVLYPAQVERLLINLYAYRESLIRIAIQYCGMQNLLAFAVYPMLDYIGQMFGISRLAAQPATCVIQIELVAALSLSYTLPEGFQVASDDDQFVFATNSPVTFAPGQTVASVTASSTQDGADANGYLPGSISTIVEGNALIASASNTSTTTGGAAPETDSDLRLRIQQAPNEFSVAGPAGAYAFFAKSVDPAIIAVQVVSPTPGTVKVYILTGPISQPAASPNLAGIAGTTLLAEVLAALNAEDVRPLTDTVEVSAVDEVDLFVTATVTLYADADPVSTQAAVTQSITNFVTGLASKIQRNVVLSEFVAALFVPGVYDVNLVAPATGFATTAGEWLNCSALNLTFATSTETST